MNLQTPFALKNCHRDLQNIELLRLETCGDLSITFWHDTTNGRVQLGLFPTAKSDELAVHRSNLIGNPEQDLVPFDNAPPVRFESLVQLKVREEVYAGGFVSGLTMRNSPSSDHLKLANQEKIIEGPKTEIRTLLESPAKTYAVLHRLWWFEGENGFRTAATLQNTGGEPLDLEFLASFSLAGISPFAETDGMGRLVLHRLRSFWSAEGRLLSQPIESLGLEPSWGVFGARVERFGQIGSMPVRDWFPFVAVEDTVAGVTWGAQLAWPGSWQMEVTRRDDFLSISGGLADRQFGHWLKTVAPGAEFSTPEARLSCAVGGLEDVCDTLTGLQKHSLEAQPRWERELPLICNDWCTHWADTNHEKIVAMAERLRDTPVKYLVIDDGWQDRPGEGMQMIGDWNVHPTRFPDLKATCDQIRANGLIPGIWFEFEACTDSAAAWNETDHFLHRDGAVLQVGARRFWDLRDLWTHDYLARKVIGLLRECGFGYLKVDYNDSIGWGVDGAESPGEGLRQHLVEVQTFFRRIRRELPDLVIENCSSGGHRLEPSMLEICAQASFSDAHESPEIPILAANLLRVMLARQSQIWAVLHVQDSPRRLGYSLSAGFLGRLCLSGEIAGLSASQMDLVNSALDFYQRVAPVIRDGKVRRFGPEVKSYRNAEGWQGVRFSTEIEILVVVHSFTGGGDVEIPLPVGNWQLTDEFSDAKRKAHIENGVLELSELSEWSGWVGRLARN